MTNILNITRILLLAASQFIPVAGFISLLILHAGENKKFSLFFPIQQLFAETKEAEKKNEKIIGFFMCLILFYHFVSVCKIINFIGGYDSNPLWFIDKPAQISNNIQNFINLF